MFLSRPSTENRASEGPGPDSRHEIAELLAGVTNALYGLKKMDERVVSYRSELIADSVERNKRHDTLLAHISFNPSTSRPPLSPLLLFSFWSHTQK
jgi:hypothetical protein